MKAKIAVATVSGKAYYLVVNELKRRSVPFMSLTPNEPIPIEIKVVITTEGEQCLVNHEKILVYRDGVELDALVSEALQIIHGKEFYERIVIGVDPGEVFGLAALADGKVIETENCFSFKQTVDRIMSMLKYLCKTPTTSVSVKVGDGVPVYRQKLLRFFDDALPSSVMLESVSEAGTNRYPNETGHSRGLRHIVSAIKIAGRNGHTFPRRKTNGSHS